jgi:hypothetical protein
MLLLEVVLELQLERLAIKPVPTNPLRPVHLVAALLPPLPTDQHIWPHPLRVQVLFLAEVANIKLQLPYLLPVIHSEVEPSSMSASIGVTPQKQVIFVALHPHSHVQVAPLEARVKTNLSILLSQHPSTSLAHPPHCLFHRV